MPNSTLFPAVRSFGLLLFISFFVLPERVEAQNLQHMSIEREGFRTINEMVNVSAENIRFNYSMQEIEIAAVRIRSNAVGARVTIDGTEQGQIDRGGGLDLFLFPGTYALNLSASGYVSRNQTLEVSENGYNEIRVELEQNIGELILDTEPSDARILLNRQDYSGQRRIELAPGRYRLEVEKQGHESYAETIEINQNESLRRNVELEPHVGRLQFSVSPSNASIELINAEGELVESWNGIQLFRNLRAGSYTLKATAEGYVPEEQQIRISKDRSLTIRFELEEQSTANITQDKTPSSSSGASQDEDEVFLVLENMPQMQGGQAALYRNLVYPEMARRANIEGRVIVQFIVDENGNVQNPQIIRSGGGGGLDEAALDAIRRVRFSPGTQRGSPVKVQMTQPVVFRLE